MRQKNLTVPSVHHTLETDRQACKLAIKNYLDKACFTPPEITSFIRQIENLEWDAVSLERWVNQNIPGKRFEDDRPRLTAALKEYDRISRIDLRREFLG